MPIQLRRFQSRDIPTCYALKYGVRSDLAWLAYNGPYFGDAVLSVADFEKYSERLIDDIHYQLITVDEEIVGEVSAYWTDGDLKKWLEIGIIIYNQSNWGKGIAQIALTQWLKYLFNTHLDIEHIGFTTWSGNTAMMQVGEKIGMLKEGTIRRVRYFKGTYYDSVKYGILRDEL